MAFVTKVWKNRLVEFAGRRKLKNVATGEEMIFDVSRSEGLVSQTGDAFSDANMNNLEQRIKNQFDTVDSNLLRYENGAAQVGTGVTKQITLKSAYTELHSFNITCFDQAGRGFALAGLEIFPPSTVKFQMLASTGIAEGPYLVGYYFVGK